MENFYNKYFLVLIDRDGTLIPIEKNNSNDICKNHAEAFARKPEILDSLTVKQVEDFNLSFGGYERSKILSAVGYIVIWPNDINNWDLCAIVSLPENMSDEQKESLKKISSNMKNDDIEFFITVNKFKKIRSSKVISDTLLQDGSYQEFSNKINSLTKTSELTNMLDENKNISI